MRNIFALLCVAFFAITLIISEDANAATLGELSRDELEVEIKKLRDEYVNKLKSGKKDVKLAKLIRDVNTALKNGDMKTVMALLSARKKRGVFSEEDAKKIIDTMTGKPEPKEKTLSPKIDFKRIKIEVLPDFFIEVIVAKPIAEVKKEEPKPTLLPGEKEAKEKTEVPPKKVPIKKLPAILLAHGGTNGISPGYVKLVQKLALEGYIVYAPYFRGQGTSDGKFEYATGELVDLLAVYHEMRSSLEINSKRIAIVGGGHGGLVALIALGNLTDIKCAAVISVPTDLEGLVMQEPLFRTQFAKKPGVLSIKNVEGLRSRSPIYLSGQISVPLLMLHGANDKYIPQKYPLGFQNVMKSLDNKNLTLKIYKSADHNLYMRYPLYREDLLSFLAKRLKPNSKPKKKKTAIPTTIKK